MGLFVPFEESKSIINVRKWRKSTLEFNIVDNFLVEFLREIFECNEILLKIPFDEENQSGCRPLWIFYN